MLGFPAILIGVLLALLLGVLSLRLGARAFGSTGIPLSHARTLQGRLAKVAGGVCIVIGLAFLGASGFGVWELVSGIRQPIAETASDREGPSGFNESDASATLAWLGRESQAIQKAANSENPGSDLRVFGSIQAFAGKCSQRRVRWIVELDEVRVPKKCTLTGPKWEAPDEPEAKVLDRFVLALEPARDIIGDNEFPVPDDLWEWLQNRPRGEKLVLTGEINGAFCSRWVDTAEPRPIRKTTFTLTIKNPKLSRAEQ